MNLPIKISDPLTTSISRDLWPIMRERLDKVGAVIIKPSHMLTEDDSILEQYLVGFMVACGWLLNKRIGFHKLRRTTMQEDLDVHTEGIYLRDGIFPFFGLGCIRPAGRGGNTRIYDARASALEIRCYNEHLHSVRARYRSAAHPEEFCEHSIVENDPDYGPVVRFRHGFDGVTYSELPDGEAMAIQSKIMKILRKHVLLDHEWQRGDILIVNNRITLHDRTGFIGERVMLRVRYGDTLNCRIRL